VIILPDRSRTTCCLHDQKAGCGQQEEGLQGLAQAGKGPGITEAINRENDQGKKEELEETGQGAGNGQQVGVEKEDGKIKKAT